MKLHFSIEYKTNWGESVQVEITQKRFNGKTLSHFFSLDTTDGLLWTGEVNISAKDIISFSYQYVICAGNTVLRREWNVVKRNFPAKTEQNFYFPDYWRDIPTFSYMYSSAYINSVSHFRETEPKFIYYDKTIIFRVQAPQLKSGECLAVLGNQPPIGGWSMDMPLRMYRCGINEWVLSISADNLVMPFEYKYVVLDEESGQFLRWEDGVNRVSPSSFPLTSNGVFVIYDQDVQVQATEWKASGLVIPVFALRSKNSQGVGDFYDLKLMVDWADKTAMHVIQLLPIYDTTQNHEWTDSYPYNCISIYALHPMYVNLMELPKLNDVAYMQRFESKRTELNSLEKIDYVSVNALKQEYLRKVYNQETEAIHQDIAFQSFYLKNEEWLVPYCAFCLLRDKYGTADFSQWPEHAKYDVNEICSFVEAHRSDTDFYAYVQYLLDKQLTETVQYARSKGVFLKGDIPIGISRNSVEAWTEPYYFNMNGQAGAPPDDFSVLGQNWGFPTYDWDRMAQDGYQWWIRRFQRMSSYFDAYRIDHVLGFFRIWEIPLHSVHGLLGQFSPSLPFSVDEMNEFGLTFNKDMMTNPYITDDVLRNVFDDKADYVRREYLEYASDGFYRMKPSYATQRQVEQAFAGRDSEGDASLREGLYRLISDVLFVPDKANPELYHPRIAVMNDFVFRALSPQEQEAFLRLYNHYFYYRHNDFWYHQAMKKLPVLLGSTQMLPCAEDLGMVPACVGPVMERLRMLSLEIQSMPKQPGLLFGKLEENPYLSVSTIFTHDMPTLREWWEENPGRSQKYFRQVLKKDGDAPRELSAVLCQEIIRQHLQSPSMLCLISFQNWLSMDENLRFPNPSEERINIPANAHHYWRYRMHLNIEELLDAAELNDRIRSLIVQSARA